MNNQAENNNRKAEILAKSRQSQQDEGIAYAVSKGAMLGNYYSGGVGFIMVIASALTGQLLIMYALFTLMGAHSFGEFLAKYRYFKQKRYMVGAIVFGIIFGGAFAFLFMRDIGILWGWLG